MAFNSLPFALFVLPVLATYLAVRRDRRWTVIGCASIAFVAVGQPVGVALLGIATTVAYVAGLAIAGLRPGRVRRMVLAGAMLLLISQWLATKYVETPGFIVLGISFYTLRLLGYLIDVYQRRVPAEREVGILVAYSAFFPEFLSGPIDRSGALVPQLRSPMPFTEAMAARGLRRFAWGLFKKAVVADQLAAFVNPVFASPISFPGISLTLAVVFFAFQMYYDFSSYSDMAIGIGEVFGFRLAKNFDRPYAAKTISEFWRRWHISFSSWLRDYVFLPVAYSISRRVETTPGLGEASRRDHATYAVTALATMLLAGLWHGAGWTFLTWGLLIGSYMVIGRLTKKTRWKLTKVIGLGKRPKMHAAVQVVTVFVLMDIAWVFFRASSMSDALYILTHLGSDLGSYLSRLIATPYVNWRGNGFLEPFLIGNSAAALLQCAAGILLVEMLYLVQRKVNLYGAVLHKPAAVRWLADAALVLAIVLFYASDAGSFLYAQF